METKKNNQVTSFLMVVGIIFIVVAGTIFVSSTWGYLPDPLKFIILLAVGSGLQLGAHSLRKKDTLKKTESALYYLGSSFFAFALYMVCKSIPVASIAALIPVSIRFIKERKTFDFVMTALLADWIVLWFQLKSDFGVVGICTMSSIVLCIYSLLDVYRNRWQENKRSIEVAFTVFYMLHIVGYVVRSLVVFFIGAFLISSEMEYLLTLVIMAAFLVAITTIHYMDRKSTFLRVLQSLAMYWLTFIGVIFLANHVFTEMTFEIGYLLVFTVCAVLLAAFARKEMYYIQLASGLFLPLFKFMDYCGRDDVLSVAIYGVMTLVFLSTTAIYYFRKERDWEPEVELFQAVAAGITQFVVFLLVAFSENLESYEFLGWLLLALQPLTVNFLIDNKVAKKVLQSIAVANFEFAAISVIFSYIPDEYQVVAGCVAFGLGVYFVGLLINSKNELVQWLQYVCACMIAIVLLTNALVDGGVENALILGIIGVATLVFAAISNSKRYVVLSSIVLVLLVFYLTRHIWASVAWWVYLFVAGVGLVAFAIKKESAERRENEVEKLESHM